MRAAPVAIGILILAAVSFGSESPADRLERIYREAKTHFKESPSDTSAAWQFARACFDLAELAQNSSDRATLAEEGIGACHAALDHKYGLAPAHYYLAMNLGQLARTKALGALKLVHEMEGEFKAAIELDEKFDYAGARRSLGLLYKDAPGWPTSIGNRGKARFNLHRAMELCPDYPDNRLSWLEALLEWGERGAVLEALPKLRESMQSARQKFTGEEWVLSWRDWNARFDRLQSKATAPSERAVSPRGK
jgi:tetratricopeptide (TPR) repeat protein